MGQLRAVAAWIRAWKSPKKLIEYSERTAYDEDNSHKEFDVEAIHKLEATVAGWLSKAPHLPEGGRKWLGENAWWIVMIGAILTALAILTGLGAIFVVGALTLGFGFIFLIGAIILLVIRAGIVVLLGMAIAPLKQRSKKGWDLLFLTLVVEAALLVLDLVVNFGLGSIFTLVYGAVGIAIAAYFVFEIRSQFVQTVAPAAEVKK